VYVCVRPRIQVPSASGTFGDNGHAETNVSEGWAQAGVKETYKRSKRDRGGWFDYGWRTRSALILRHVTKKDDGPVV
jgi:hypothetical protein